MKILLMIPILVLLSCAAKAPKIVEAPKPEKEIIVGLASWYGHEAPNTRTANNDVWKPMGISAAHKTLPFGTLVKVTNLENGKEIVVRINDRGPFYEERIIDLSKGAAIAIGLYGKGVGEVELEIIKPKPTVDTAGI